MDILLDSQNLFTPAGAPTNDIELLNHAILNEKNAPEVLDFKEDLVQRLQTALETQEEYVEQLDSDMSQELRRMVLNLENKRVRYLLKLYHRTRLKKIEKFAASIVADDQFQGRLSESEREYCKEYFVLLGRHFRSVVLDQLPVDFRPLAKLSELSTSNDLILQPVLDTHVFAKAMVDIQMSEGLESHTIQNGDLLIMRYRPIANLVRAGQMRLI